MTFTLTLTLLAAVMGLALGTLLAMMRLSRFKLLSVPAGIYVSVMRSIPLLLVIFWFYFLVPYMAAWAMGSPTPVRVGAFIGGDHLHPVRGRLLLRNHAGRHPVDLARAGLGRPGAGIEPVAGHALRGAAAGLAT